MILACTLEMLQLDRTWDRELVGKLLRSQELRRSRKIKVDSRRTSVRLDERIHLQ